jgi:ComF family protein
MFDLKKFLVDLLFPIQCLGCDKPEEWLCQNCLTEIKINNSEASELDQNGFLTGIWVAADYQQPLLVKILHSFKYSFVSDLGLNLGKLLIRFLENKIKKIDFLDFDLIVAVPLAKKRRLWRGYNQAEILTEIISQRFAWPLASDVILRQYHTHPQVGLKAAERLINVKGIFKINNYQLLKNKKVLLIDDVITTGATMQECAKVLREAGAKEVWGLVVAKG